MKTKIIIAASLLAVGAVNAQSFTEDFSNGQGEFTALNNTTVNTTADAIEFVNTNGQGGGITLDINTDAVLGNGFNNADAQSLFFQFDTIVPVGTGAQDELGFFFGPSSNQAQSSDIFNGNNTNGFTIFFDNGGLFAQNNGQGSQSSAANGSASILSGLDEGSNITIGIEWFLTPAQNNGQFNNAFTVTATGFDELGNQVTATDTFDGAINQGAAQINNFQFTASTTQGLTGTLDNFTVSTEPIPADSIPEPSSALLTGLGALALLSRRRRA